MNKRKIPFFNYRFLFESEQIELMKIVEDVCKRGAYIMQSDLLDFEREAAEFLKVKHFLGVADGSNAISLSLIAAGIKPGDEVILPSHTFIATAAAVKYIGAIPVLADCGTDHLIDPQSVKDVITSKTKCLLPVHLNGRTCTMDPLLDIARDHDLKIVEDAAQAFGSTFNGQAAGSFGVAGTISFYPAKVIGCLGDGGGILTNHTDTHELLYALRDHGRASNGEIICWGTNCRLDNLQAAILRFRLKSFPKAINRRREIAQIYHEYLSNIPGLVLPPKPEKSGKHFDIFQNYEIESDRRDRLKTFLQEQGIGTLIQWGGKAVHQHGALEFKCSLPKTDLLFERSLMLPMNTSLSDEDVIYISEAIKQFYQ